MKQIAVTSGVLGLSLVVLGNVGPTDVDWPADSQPPSLSAHATAAPMTAADFNDVIQESCVRCHSERRMTGNLSLEGFDVAAAPQNGDVAEKVIRKLRAGMMPPQGANRPAGDTLIDLAVELETIVDEAWRRAPDPGRRLFQRMNIPEYENAIRDLLALEVDATAWLPADQMMANFDNIADAQQLSPLLLEAYLNAASEISRMAIGDRNAPSIDVVYKNSEYLSQHPWDHLPGAPYGTRGGIVVDHVFPADGEYVFGMDFAMGSGSRFEDVDISIDGERVGLVAFTRVGQGADGRGSAPVAAEPVFVRAGQHTVSAAFVRRQEGPYEDLIRPHDWSMAGGGSGGGGITTLPHVRSFVISGPDNATGVSDSPTRQLIFTCRPTVPSEEETCARQVIENMASRAYRRAVSEDEVEGLMWFYNDGLEKGGFEVGVRTALEAVLASPFFVLRLESEPQNLDAGEVFGLEGIDLANRLSFFLWGTSPDEELLRLAEAGRLSDVNVLEQQTVRMLDDRRSAAMGERFAAQWLRLQDLYKVRPDPNFYPNFDENLADLMHEETERFFNYLVREDRDMLDMFSAKYTFVNEKLARHYGLPNVGGEAFRYVEYPDDTPRSGLLGHGSVLVLTSMANRTSPVLRGKWVMEVLLGSPPPPPPPNVPSLEESTEEVSDGKPLTTRQRMEMHRANPTCNSCHSMIDPVGLALDNFDVTGRWRLRENGTALDTRGELFDGTQVSSPSDLAEAVLARPLPLARNFTENLMAFAVGRRMEYFDRPAIRQVVWDAENGDGGYSMRSLITGVVKSDAFRMKRAAAVSADQAGN
jgi:hypothetical protein